MFLITDQPDCYTESASKFDVKLLKAPPYRDIMEIKAMKTRIFEFVPQKVQSVLYLDVDILVTRSMRTFLQDLATLHPFSWREEWRERNASHSHFKSSVTIPPGKYPGHVDEKFDMGLFLGFYFALFFSV